ncbi:MAG: CBS domain-containing protein, partial [Rhodospirillaceae bacterium]
MDADTATVSAALEHRYLLDYPHKAAQQIERLPLSETISSLAAQPAATLRPMMEHVATDVGAKIIAGLKAETAQDLMGLLHPGIAVELLGQMGKAARQQLLAHVAPNVRQELERFMSYPPGSAGRIMDSRFAVLRSGMTAEKAISRLRQSDITGQRAFIVVDEENRVVSRVNVEDLVVAVPDAVVDTFAKPISKVLDLQSTEEEVAEIVSATGMASIPVVNAEGRLVGVVRPREAIRAVEETASANVQTMVGASASEHGLSPPLFAVRKRIGWLTINLATAFLAAAVVGLFEDTIAAYTALAVLLPVVA